jgi:imidazolonepropionase-like amidohydrolase
MKQAFVGATIYPVETEPIENGTIIIENGIIVDLGTNLSTNGGNKLCW